MLKKYYIFIVEHDRVEPDTKVLLPESNLWLENALNDFTRDGYIFDQFLSKRSLEGIVNQATILFYKQNVK